MKKTKSIYIGNVEIGGDAPVSVQSMCNTNTADVPATVNQIKELADAGCEIIRVAVPDSESATVLKEIKSKINIPIVADIHFDWRLAIDAMNNGADAIRINPGNIGKEYIKKIVKSAKEKQIPIRVGVNSGSLEKGLSYENLSESLVKSALNSIKLLEDNDFDLIKVSLKSSSVPVMIQAYEKISKITDYPLHLGVTEAGFGESGIIKSAVGIGTLLSKGIGNTIRVSLTDNPVEEVMAGWEILKALELRQRGINFISCPTCGRTQIDVIRLAREVKQRFAHITAPLTVAVMGCAVNGPGEAKHADIGVAGGINEGYIFKKGEIVAKVSENQILETLEKELRALLKG